MAEVGLQVKLNEDAIRAAIREYIERKYDMVIPHNCKLIIEVKSKQNYKSEWEVAAFRGVLESF